MREKQYVLHSRFCCILEDTNSVFDRQYCIHGYKDHIYHTYAQLCRITCCKPSQTRLLLSITGYVKSRNMFTSTTVAHVLEESTGKWWRFDDETVTTMPDGPVGERADHGVSTPPGTSTRKVQAGTMKLSSAHFYCLRQACATWTTALSARPQCFT